MTTDAAREATAAHQRGEPAKVSKAKAQVAYVRLRICFMNNAPSINSVELIVLNGSLTGHQCCADYHAVAVKGGTGQISGGNSVPDNEGIGEDCHDGEAACG
jgi:hypothetical protein